MKLIYSLLILFISLNAFSQTSLKCSFDEMNKSNKESGQVSTTGILQHQVYVIPVVFHVLHEYGQENISRWQILDALRILNEDYRKMNADTVNIIPVFKPIAADCEIEFRLATLDPNGNCTDGIDRIFSHATYLANDGSKINHWPNNKYLNIWTAKSLQNSAASGYAHLPGGVDSLDGIMMQYNYVGSIGSSNFANSRSLTHEIGHYFNLYHLWGSSGSQLSCGDDYVNDTPETKGATTCDLTLSVCNPPIIENVQNFMEFSGCQIMFTQGQKMRMDTALNSSLSGRNNLWSSANLIATGTTGSASITCSPIADFASSSYACTGSTVSFYDASWNAPITSRSWFFPGGNPSTSTDSNPTVTYPVAGIYDVKLIVTGTNGIDSITRTNFVYISDTALTGIPFTEDFENVNSFPGIDGWIENLDSSSVNVWARTDSANTTTGGSYCIKINNFTNEAGKEDSWVTPSLNFTNVGFPIHVYFKVAYAQRSSISDDELRLLYSLDCGNTWLSTTYDKSGIILSTAPITTGNFTPSSISQWRQENVFCNNLQNQSNVRLKFSNISDGGNNVFIDDINITGNITGINENKGANDAFIIYPNPTNGNTTLKLILSEQNKGKISVKDVLGKVIYSFPEMLFSQGENKINIPLLSPGVYFVDMSGSSKSYVRKLIIN